MNRINLLFEQKKERILSVYFTAGFPSVNDTMPVLKALQEGGIDMVEVGFPFSDPMADGPVIQSSSHVALQNGMTLRLLFDQLKTMRQAIKMPVILMGYLNVIMQYGVEAFCQDCVRVGIDGVILPDLPISDYITSFKPMMDKYGLSMVLLITPETSDERIREIDAYSESFIYMVSSASVTGAQQHFNDTKVAYFKRISEMGLKNPRLVGFGISNQSTFNAACEHASGAIIGSRFIECLQKTSTPVEAVTLLLNGLNDSLNA